MEKLTITTNRGNFSAQLLGKRGDWVVCWPAQLNDMGSMKEFARMLARNFRVLLCDPPAVGINQNLPYSNAITDLVFYANLTLIQLDIKQCHWIGQSAGGVVGAALLHESPDRIASLTLASTPMLSQGRFKLHIAASTALLSGSRFGRHILASRGASEMGFADEKEKKQLAAYLRYALECMSPKTISKLRPLEGADVRRVFEKLRNKPPPMLILSGQHDRTVLARDQRTVAEITGSQYVEFNCGHLPLLIAPKACAQAFQRFVQALPQRDAWRETERQPIAA